ncbi:MAG TPA: CoA transferase [Thermoanaerobaculia bacterium]|nr:CoA transferase [Thermoanaerobaculia bacterium]
MPLTGTRVLDFTRHLPGPYATDLLRRLGAEVIKIEPPDGDPTRWLPPIVGDFGALFTLVNSGKKSVVVDLKSDEGRAFVHRLARQCDVVLESYRPGVARRFGIDAETLRTLEPRLIHCSISGFGESRERSAHDLNFVALAGLLDLQRDQAGNPVLPATQIGDMGGSLFGVVAILAALIERQKSGLGRKIDISMSDATRSMMPTAEAMYRGTHARPDQFMLTGAIPSYNVYRTADGKHLVAAPLEPQFWQRFCESIGRPEWIEHQYDAARRPEVFNAIREAIASKTRAEWERIFDGIDACVEPVLTIEEAHDRFGDPLQRHPLQVNFPRAQPPAVSLGESLPEVAAAMGFDAAEAGRMARSDTFRPRERMKKLIATSVMKLAQRFGRKP